mgnify:CR=1 FL=1
METRPDRKEHAENELRSLGWNPKRFNAIKLSNGALGCSTSHLRCLELAKSEGLDHILICEDDITFLNNRSLSDRYPEMAWNEFFIR